MYSLDNMVSKNKMESRISNTALRLTSIMMIFFTLLVSGQRPAAVDTWVLINRDRYVLSYTVTLLRTPRVTWWWKSTAHNSKFEHLTHMNMGSFRETVTPAVNENPDGSILYDVRLEISNINSSIFGEYKVDINGDDDLTRYFTVNEMPDQDKTLDDDKFEFSKGQVYIAVGVAVGILMVVAIITVTLMIRIKTKKSARAQSPMGIQMDNNSGGMSISSHHYTDVHSNAGYEGLGEKLDSHEYLTTLNTAANRGAYNDPAVHHSVKPLMKTTGGSFENSMYGKQHHVIKSAINPQSLLKPVPKFTHKNKQNKGRRFSDSTSDREESIIYENVAKAKSGHSYENCNHLKRTKSAQ